MQGSGVSPCTSNQTASALNSLALMDAEYNKCLGPAYQPLGDWIVLMLILS